MRIVPKYARAAGLVAVVLATAAIAAGEGDPILGGDRNPGRDRSVELHDETQIIAGTGEYGTRQSNKGSGGCAIHGIEVGDPGAQPFATDGRGKVENLNADMADSTDVSPIIVRMSPGTSTPRSLAGPGSLSVNASCGADGDISVTASTDEPAIIQGFAHGVEEGRGGWTGKDGSFTPGEIFATGFDQSHSGTLRYVDDDEAVTVDLSTDEQSGTQPSCLVFGTAFAGPHAVDASITDG